MTLDGSVHILGKVTVDRGCRVLRKQRDALGEGTAGWNWRVDHSHRQLATLDHDFGTRAHPRQQAMEVAGGFRLG